jgi:hypothetical protein
MYRSDTKRHATVDFGGFVPFWPAEWYFMVQFAS